MDRLNKPSCRTSEAFSTSERTLTRRELLTGSTVGTASLLLAGCGGGHSSIGGGAGASLTDAQRLTVLDSVGHMFQSLPGVDSVADNQAMAKYLSGRSEFKQVSISNEGTVSASFQDGRLLVIYNNRIPIGAPGKQVALPGVNLRTGRASATELPTPTQARVTTSLGTCFTLSTITSIRALLENRGYNLVFKVGQSVQTGATVEELKKVSGDGVFFMLAHGGVAHRLDGSDIITVSTQSEPTLASEALYQPDLDDATLGYAFSKTDEIPGGGCTTPKRYVFTSKFITKYMRFGPNSFVMFNACSSASDPKFLSACFSAGASLFVGWTRPALDDDASNAALFLIDRMLGANEFEAEVPKQRPFDYRAVAGQMSQVVPELGHALDTTTSPKYGVSKLIFTSNPKDGQGDFALLAPTIGVLNVDMNSNHLIVLGIFGNVAGMVTIGGQSIDLLSWTPSAITCTLPPHDAPNASGDVVVTVRGHKSNTVKLTMWVVTLNNESKYDYSGKTLNDTVSGSYTYKAALKLWLRGDATGERIRPGSLTGDNHANGNFGLVHPMPTNDAMLTSYSVTGSLTHSVMVGDSTKQIMETISPVGTAPVALDGSDSRVSAGGSGLDLVAATIDPVAMTLSFKISLPLSGTVTASVPDNDAAAIGLPSLQFMDKIMMSLDGSYGIAAGSTAPHVLAGSQYTYTRTLSWEAAAAQNAPDANVQRSASRVSKRPGR